MNPSELSAWYKEKHVVLWVEDPLTRVYLHALWQDTEIKLLVGGGNDAVVAAVRDARASGHGNVFGLRDRDFLSSNREDWSDPAKQPHVFRPQAHEVENYLLRPDILEALDENLNPQSRHWAELEHRAQTLATESLWWMVCRAVTHDARQHATDEFPGHPTWGERTVIVDAPSAQARLEADLMASSWGRAISAWIPALDGAWIGSRIAAHHKTYTDGLADGSWSILWSGKDIFKEIAGFVNVGKRKAVAAEELAKAIGQWQNANERDGEMWDLHAALRWRAGAGPQPLPPAQPAAGGPI